LFPGHSTDFLVSRFHKAAVPTLFRFTPPLILSPFPQLVWHTFTARSLLIGRILPRGNIWAFVREAYSESHLLFFFALVGPIILKTLGPSLTASFDLCFDSWLSCFFQLAEVPGHLFTFPPLFLPLSAFFRSPTSFFHIAVAYSS